MHDVRPTHFVGIALFVWSSLLSVPAFAQIDFSGQWAVRYHEDFEERSPGGERDVYVDGRPHPPEEAPHTWSGFSTGKWEGDMLTVTTTHLKEYIIRRDGVPVSDRSTMIEHWMRHGDYLTVVQIITDPVYLTEPFIQSTDFILDLHIGDVPNLCEVEEESDHPKGWVPHRLPGTANEEETFAKKH